MMVRKQRHPITGCRVDTLLNDLWLVSSPQILEAWVNQAFTYDLHTLVKDATEAAEKPKDDDFGYTVKDGVAVMHVNGAITKYPTSFSKVMGGTSCKGMECALDHAAANPEVKAIVIQGESHGGTADGVDRLSRRIKSIDTKTKPVFGYADDVACSAMYWILSGTREIGASPTAIVGSVGGMMLLKDTSEAFKREGIKVIPVKTGSFKAVSAPGSVITDEEAKYVESLITSRVQPFFSAVETGRRLTKEKLEPIIRTAKTYSASEGKEVGLVDVLTDLDEFVDRVRSETVNTTHISLPGNGSPSGNGVQQVAAQTGRSTMQLSEAQLASIRTVCGRNDITAETALDALLARATTLDKDLVASNTELQTIKNQAPKPIDPEVLKGRVANKTERFDILTSKGQITQAQCDFLKKLVTENPNVLVASSLKDGNPVIDAVISAMQLGTGTGLTEEAKSGAQAQPFVPSGGANDLGKLAEQVIDRHLKTASTDYDPFGAPTQGSVLANTK